LEIDGGGSDSGSVMLIFMACFPFIVLLYFSKMLTLVGAVGDLLGSFARRSYAGSDEGEGVWGIRP